MLACVDNTFTSLCVFLVLLLTDCIFHRKNYSTNTLARLEKREMRNKEKKVSNLTPTYAFNLMRLFSIDKIHKFSSLFHLRERAASHIFWKCIDFLSTLDSDDAVIPWKTFVMNEIKNCFWPFAYEIWYEWVTPLGRVRIRVWRTSNQANDASYFIFYFHSHESVVVPRK